MARLILQTGDGAGDIGNSVSVDVIGTNAAETINVSNNGKGTFDGSFSRGNDTIVIAGNAANYSIRQTGANQVAITNAAGANLVIPVGTGVTIKFLDVTDGRTLTFNSSNAIVLGTQTVGATASTITAGSTTPPPPSGDAIYLEVTRDVLAGTAAADVFQADLIQNQLGEQTNSLGTGDRLTGGEGVDTLFATVQDASALNASPGSAIAPITSSVEQVYVTALDQYDSRNNPNSNQNDIVLGVEINAKSMTGLTEIGSVQSDTSLTYYNVNTLASGADITDESSARRTSSVRVRMDRTGPSSPTDDAANLTVLFDNDYLRPDDSSTSGSLIRIQMMDLDAAIRDAPAQPLLNNPYTSFVFNFGSTPITITIKETSDTYALLLKDFQDGLAANPLTAGKVTATLGIPFTANDTDSDPGGSQTGTEIQLVNSSGEVLTPVRFVAANGVPTDLDFHLQTFTNPPTTVTPLITVDVEIDKVGRNGDGGYLTIGGMATVGQYTSESSTLRSNTLSEGLGLAQSGVQQINLHVEGSAIEPSSLAGVQSTHNALRVITVDNVGSTASLTIGNAQTLVAANGISGSVGVSGVRNNAVKDVLVFDASKFTATSTVWAMLSDEFRAKYLNVGDFQADPRADNRLMDYTFGSGNNTLNLNISKSNVSVTTNPGAATREDFEGRIRTNEGNDTLLFQIGDGVSAPSREGNQVAGPVQNWATNHIINAYRYIDVTAAGTAIGNDRYKDMQVNVDMGSGNDTVTLWGSTAEHVDLGSGDDTIYTDNSDAKPVWVFNSMDDTTWQLGDLQSQTILNAVNANNQHVPVSVTKIANLVLNVSFKGIESRSVAVANSLNSTGVTVTDLHINQAIKDAINADPILSKLLLAQDGPSGTLVVSSRVDGVVLNTDLVISVANSGPLTAAQTAAGARLYSSVTAAEAAALGFSASGVALGSTAITDDRWYSDFGLLAGGAQATGRDSLQTNVNVVEGNTGNDIIVLSTHGELNGVSAQTNPDGSTETIDIDAFFGNDTVLEFTAAVGNAGQAEVQTLTFTGAPTAQPGNPNGDGVVTLSVPNLAGGTLTIPNIAIDSVTGGANPTTAAEIATAVAAAINTAADNGATAATTDNVVNAVASGGVVTLTYTQGGINVNQATATIVPALSTNEIQNLVLFTGAQSGPLDGPNGTLQAGTITVTFGDETQSVTFGPSTAYTTPDQVLAQLATLFAASPLPATGVDTAGAADASIQLTDNVAGRNVNPMTVVISQLAAAPGLEALNFVVNTVQEGYNYGLTATGATISQGTAGKAGYDIFDLTTVMGPADPVHFHNYLPGNGAEPDGGLYNEVSHIQSELTFNGAIVITDTLWAASDWTLASADPGASLSGQAAEQARILAAVKAGDTAASTAVTHQVIITVDSDNVGYFYHITNGTAVGDATSEYLGSIELGTYKLAGKEAVGNWDLMTVANFIPLNAASVTDTFLIA